MAIIIVDAAYQAAMSNNFIYVSSGDTVILGDGLTGYLNILQDPADASPAAEIDVIFSGDSPNLVRVWMRDDTVADVTVEANVNVLDTQIRLDAPDFTSSQTITIEDGATMGEIYIDRTDNTIVEINSGDNVTWGEAGQDDPRSVWSNLRESDNSNVDVNLGTNNTVLTKSFIVNSYGGVDVNVDGATFDTDPVSGSAPSVILTGNYTGDDGVNTIHADDVTINQASYLYAGRGGDDTAYVRGLTHITTSNDNHGRLLMAAGDDTLYLGGDLSASDDTYNVNGGSGHDTLNFQFVDAAQEAEFIASFIDAGGSYDAATNTFGDATGLTWSINQNDGSGIIYFTGWEETSLSPLCFAAGTMISTDIGDVAVEDLTAGDMVRTMDHGFQQIQWIGRSTWNGTELANKPNMRPVRIKAGVLGAGLPKQDVTVSRQHRMLVDSKIAHRMFDSSEVLIPAKDLTCLDGVDVLEAAEGVQYFHLMCAEHEIIYAEGAPSETLYLGQEALKSLGTDARAEINVLFPEIGKSDHETNTRPVRPLAKGKRVKNMLARHKLNNMALLSDIV